MQTLRANNLQFIRSQVAKRDNLLCPGVAADLLKILNLKEL
jgi:hypothetical protein